MGKLILYFRSFSKLINLKLINWFFGGEGYVVGSSPVSIGPKSGMASGNREDVG